MNEPPDRRDIAATFPGGARRVAPVLQEEARFEAFCATHGLDASPDAVALYLVMLLDTEHLSGNGLRRRLSLIDASYQLDGLSPPSRDRGLRTFLRGLHQEATLGPTRARQPLYIEDVLAMLDAIDSDRLSQIRDVALLLLANATGMKTDSLRHLGWNDVRLSRQRATLQVATTGPIGPKGKLVVDGQEWPRTVEALRALRRQVGPTEDVVFAHTPGLLPAIQTFKPALDLLPGRSRPNGGWGHRTPETEDDLADRISLLSRPSVRQLRDKALIVLGFAGCLTSREAHCLRVEHVKVHEAGLLLDSGDRGWPTAVNNGNRPQSAPQHLWREWVARYAATGCAPAFPQIYGGNPHRDALDQKGLRQAVQANARRAWLDGNYSFSSLRIGFVRTAVRQGVPESMILKQAQIRHVESLSVHIRRERLLTHNVLHLIGM